MDTLIHEALTVMPLGQVLVILLLYWIGMSVKSVRTSVETLKIGMTTTQEWQRGHEKIDDERHITVMNRLDNIGVTTQ